MSGRVEPLGADGSVAGPAWEAPAPVASQPEQHALSPDRRAARRASSSPARSPRTSPLRRLRTSLSLGRSGASPKRRGSAGDGLGDNLLDVSPMDSRFDDLLEGAGEGVPSPYAARRPAKGLNASHAALPDTPTLVGEHRDAAVALGPMSVLDLTGDGDHGGGGGEHDEHDDDDFVFERGRHSSGAKSGAPPLQHPWSWWAWGLLAAQVRVLVPVSTFLILFQTFALGQPVRGLGSVIGGLVAAIVGLSLFMLGLEIGVMPLGEALGRALPRRVKVGTLLLLVFVLGCTCTFAEPAVSALQIAGQLIDPADSPYLWLMLVDPGFNFVLVVAIAFGVGVAAVVGTGRTMRAWNLKVVILCSVAVCLVLTAALEASPAAELAGMAWDTGAVTTGCVTVPLVLALGTGVLHSTRPSGSGPGDRDPSPLDGFGIVTLASLYPVCCVLTLGLAVGGTVSVDDILERQQRALNASAARRFGGASTATTTTTSLATAVASSTTTATTTAAEVTVVDPDLEEQSAWQTTPWLELYLTVRAFTPLLGFLVAVFWWMGERFPRVSIGPPRHEFKDKAVWHGVGASFVGLFVFNIGLSKGLSTLGGDVGAALPGLFTRVDGNDRSPLVGRSGGVAVAALFCWFLGLCATLAEPALNQLGITTAELTRGRFRKGLVIGSVAGGVSVGVMLGALKLVLDTPWALFLMLYIGYALALALTAASTDEFVCVAWDSAGVTTGAVTVPLVLAVGLGIGLAVGAKDAFGLLAMASVMPILSVLSTGLTLTALSRRRSGGGSASVEAGAEGGRYTPLRNNKAAAALADTGGAAVHDKVPESAADGRSEGGGGHGGKRGSSTLTSRLTSDA